MLCKICGVEMAIISTNMTQSGDDMSVYEQKWACMNKNCGNYDPAWEKKDKQETRDEG